MHEDLLEQRQRPGASGVAGDLVTGQSPENARTTCLVAVWDGPYRMRCSMGTKGVCGRHGAHQPHPNDGKPCAPNPHDGYCHEHGVYMAPSTSPGTPNGGA